MGGEDGQEYPNPSETEMRFNFSFPLDMDRVTNKYMKIGYEDREYKTRPHPSPLPCLLTLACTQKLIPTPIEKSPSPRPTSTVNLTIVSLTQHF